MTVHAALAKTEVPCVMLVLLLAFAIPHISTAKSAELSREDMLSYLAETVCPLANEQVDLKIKDASCARARLRLESDNPRSRRHDWPGIEDAAASPSGYQRSDAYLTSRSGNPIAVQTFDFGTGGRAFGVFDKGKGDGGQVAEVDGPAAAFTLTEDGGDGVQWFAGPRCWGEGDPLTSGWLVFSSSLKEAWTQSIVRLQKVRSRADCPRSFSRSLTRWRRQLIDWPFLSEGRARERIRLDTLISEHYATEDIAHSDHLERFFLAKGIGLIRWERWQNLVRGNQGFDRQAEKLAASRRCPPVDGSLAPATAWVMIDCRTWTNIVASREYEPAHIDWYRGE